MTLEAGTPVQNRSTVEELYRSLNVQKSDFFVNVLEAARFNWDMEQKDLVIVGKKTSSLRVFSQRPEMPIFLPSANKILIPEHFLHKDTLTLDDTHL